MCVQLFTGFELAALNICALTRAVFGLGVFGMPRHALVSLRHAAPSQRQAACPLPLF